MKKLIIGPWLLLIAPLLLALSSCMLDCATGSGHQVSQTRKADDFTKIDISGAFKVNLKQDSSLNINITADDNLLKYIETSVDGSTLYIKDKRSLCDEGRISVDVGIHNLDRLSASGAVEVNADSTLHAGDITFDLSGASKVSLGLEASKVDIESHGASELYLKGQAGEGAIDISGAGKVYAFDFVVGDYDIDASGASNCQVNVLHTLNVRGGGASDIEYKGSPATVNNDSSGASSVNKAD